MDTLPEELYSAFVELHARAKRNFTLTVSRKGADGYVRAHGCRLTGKMSGGGLRSVVWASVVTLV
eukprot:COSAG02_NODE_8893_length_2406_cov_1.256610_3_plen_65_part_00